MQIDAVKFERTQIHFLETFSLPSSSSLSLLKVPIIRGRYVPSLVLSLYCGRVCVQIEEAHAITANKIVIKLGGISFFNEFGNILEIVNWTKVRKKPPQGQHWLFLAKVATLRILVPLASHQ